MKSKGIFGLVVFGILVGFLNSCAFAADSTSDELQATKDELKRVTEERDALKGNQTNTAEESTSNWWATLGLKEWMTTYAPEGGASTNGSVQMFAVTGGYDRYFFNWAGNSQIEYSDPSYVYGSYRHFQQSVNIGYLVTPKVAVVIGKKILNEGYIYPNSSWTTKPEGSDKTLLEGATTLGANFAHRFEGTSFSLNSNIAYGTYSLSAVSTGMDRFSGTLSGNGTYLGYEIGGGYSLTRSLTFLMGYRAEQHDALVPTQVTSTVWPYSAVLGMRKISISGITAGIAYLF